MLSGSEQKVLDFILRQILGFVNDSNKISMSQFQNGYGKDNKGTGLGKKSILKAIKGLEAKGFIRREGERYRLYRYSLVMSKSGVKNTPKKVKNTPKSVKSIPKKVKRSQTIEASNRGLLKEDIKKIFSLFKEKICPTYSLTPDGEKMVAEKLKKYSLQELTRTIINFSRDKWNMERNAGRGIEWLFKTESRVEEFKNKKLLPENGGEEILRRGSYQKEMLTAPIRSDSVKSGFLSVEKINGKERIVHHSPTNSE